MDDAQQKEVQSYFNIDVRINKVKKRIKRLNQTFYNQSFLPQKVDLGSDVVIVGFNVEQNVTYHLDVIRDLEENIKCLSDKKCFMDKYLSDLPYNQRAYLIKKYKYKICEVDIKEFDDDVCEEVQEIQEAINFMYGFPQDLKVNYDESTSMKSNINNIAAALGV